MAARLLRPVVDGVNVFFDRGALKLNLKKEVWDEQADKKSGLSCRQVWRLVLQDVREVSLKTTG